jgi:hypothetical protein
MILQGAEDSVDEAHDLEDIRARYRRMLLVNASVEGTEERWMDLP